jgi:hypothetical protein
VTLKTSLLHPRKSRRARRGRHALAPHELEGAQQELESVERAAPQAELVRAHAEREETRAGDREAREALQALHPRACSPTCDEAVQRVREAGGPTDQAAYVCQCGYVFSAEVSTSVACPHCGTDQAW